MTAEAEILDLDPKITDAFAGRHVLVTGGAGFIGSYLVEALIDLEAHVTVLDDLRTGREENLANVRNRIRFVCAPVEEACVVGGSSWNDLHYIFHLANSSYVPPSLDNPFTDLRNNVVSTLRVVELGRRRCTSAVILFTSSAAIYGEPDRIPISEEHLPRPISPYGVSKLAAEQYVSVYARLYGLRTASLRLFSVFGPRQRKQVVYDMFGKLMRNPKKLEIIGDGTESRDLIYVQDVVRALLFVACNGRLHGEVYNVGTAQMITTQDLALKIAKEMDLSPAFGFSGRSRPGDPKRWLADIARVSGVGFEPAYSLEYGLKAVREWLLSNGVSH